MQTTILAACSALLLTSLSAHANKPSPAYRVTVGKTIDVVDRSGKVVLTLDDNATGLKGVQVSWSANGQRVVIVENVSRGSAVFGAWHDGLSWHKAVQSAFDSAALIQSVTSQASAHLVSEERSLGSWIGPDAVRIHGELQLSDGRYPYDYVLNFTAPGATRMSRGGYEEGALKGSGYQLAQ